MQRTSRWFGFGVAATGLYLAIACTSTTTGNEGNLDFSYFADDDIRNFNKPIAVGAKLELRVKQTGTGADVTLKDALSDDNGVLSIETFTGNRLVLVGEGEGGATIEVSAQVLNGEVVTDSVNMLSAVPDVLELRHSCGQDANYFVDTEEILIGYDFKKSNGQDVIGFGYFPIELTGDATVTLDTTSADQAAFHFAVGSMPGTATIESTIDDTKLALGIVLPSEVDGLEVGGGTQLAVQAGSSRYIRVYPTVGGDRVCQSKIELTASSDTPDICDVRAIPPIQTDDGTIGAFDNLIVEGKALGECVYTVTFPPGLDGAGVSSNFSIDVQQLVTPDEDA